MIGFAIWQPGREMAVPGTLSVSYGRAARLSRLPESRRPDTIPGTSAPIILTCMHHREAPSCFDRARNECL